MIALLTALGDGLWWFLLHSIAPAVLGILFVEGCMWLYSRGGR